MTDEEIEKALKDRAYEISYGDHNDKWIFPKDKLSQEAMAYIERLKEACQSAIQSFTRMETLYKIKCTELECVKEQIRKDMAKEIWQSLYNECCRNPDLYNITLNRNDIIIQARCYGVEVSDE